MTRALLSGDSGSLPPRVETDVDPSKLLGVRRTGLGVVAYKRLLRRDPCAYCGRPYWGIPAELDHIVARARGGANGWENLTAACGFCNVLKCDESALETLLRLNVDMPAFIAERMRAA